MNIFPIPAKIHVSAILRDFSGASWILLPQDAGFPLKKRIMDMAKELSKRFIRPLRVSAGQPSAGDELAVMTRQTGMGPEEYRLSLASSGPIELFASNDSGFYYGMQTVCQLLAVPDSTPCCTITDRPSMRERGYMLDISRDKVPTMETVKSLVRSLALLRYNSLQLYMEHTFSFAAHERVWADYSPFTPEEIMELDAFCHEYFIELVPNLNSFGHLARWLEHEEYKSLAECDPPKNLLYPGKESLDFIDGLYAEFLPNFTSKKINIGCDETDELGQGKSAAACKKKGVTPVYLDFLTKLAKKASARGCKVEFWGDIILHQPELISKLPKGIIALEWGYEANHPFERDTMLFKKSNVDFLVCPGTSSWNTIVGRTSNMIGNIANAAENGCKNKALGMLMTDWGDRGHHQYYPVSWPGIVMGGGASWNAGTKETEKLLAYGVSLAFAPGSEGVRMGKFLLKMGQINDDYTHQIGNCTVFGFLMTAYSRWQKSKGGIITKITRAEVRKAIQHTQKLLDELIREPFAGYPLENSELVNALSMALASQAFLYGVVGGEWDKANWRDSMRHIIAEHERLWLIRNRVGGLRDSSSYLRILLESDPVDWTKR